MNNSSTKSILARIHTRIGLIVFVVALFANLGSAQTGKSRTMTGSAAKSGAPADLKVVPDLPQRLARFQRVPMPFQTAGLISREQQLVRKLVESCGYLESIYWRQSDPDGLTLYQSLATSRNRRDVELRRYLWINASRFDLLDQNKPFVGTEPMPPGRGFYPANLTREQVEEYVTLHPEQKAAIYNQFTIVRWRLGMLESVPYHIAFRAFLEPAAEALRAAA